MGQGTSAPVTPDTPDASAAASNGQRNPNLTPQQTQAIAMLMSQMGKTGQLAPSMQGQTQQNTPQTVTVQGGTYFNPYQQR